MEHSNTTRLSEMEKLEKSFNDALDTINQTDESLKKAREEIQRLKLANSDLKHRNELLQKRVDELYSSVGII